MIRTVRAIRHLCAHSGVAAWLLPGSVLAGTKRPRKSSSRLQSDQGKIPGSLQAPRQIGKGPEKMVESSFPIALQGFPKSRMA